MATARVTSTDFLFWFRSHAANEIRWGGAKHHPEDEDDGGRMHPRSSFKAFLEVVKRKSSPWEILEMNAIHSLQLIMRDSFQNIEKNDLRHSQHNDSNGPSLDELRSLANEMIKLIETATTPIFGVDISGSINGWNAKMAELTGLQASEALGKSLLNEIIHEDSRPAFQRVLDKALHGNEDKNIKVKLKNFRIHPANPVVQLIVNACTSWDYTSEIIGVCFVGQDITFEEVVQDKFIRMQGDYKAIIQSLNPLIPPIFACDEDGFCSEWSAAMEKLTGWMKHEVVGMLLPGEVFGGLCQLKDNDNDLTEFLIVLHQAFRGHNTGNMRFGFFNRDGKFVEVFLTANKRVNEHGAMVGCFFFVQTVPVDQPSSSLSQQEGECILKLEELDYICEGMKNPLNGIQFTHKLLKGMDISDDQKQLLDTSDACARQIMSVIEDMNFGGIIEGRRMELNCEEFTSAKVIDAVVSQVMVLLEEKNLQLIRDIPDQMKTLLLYGDQMKLQLVLSNFLFSIVNHTPCDGWVEIKVFPRLKLVEDRHEYVRVQFRLAHQGEGLPFILIEQMFWGRRPCSTQQGVALNFCRELVKLMNGTVYYIRDPTSCYFNIGLKFRIQNSRLED